jgi:hypothetical protein
MHEAVEPLVEMYEWVWTRFKQDLKDLTPEEIDWRPLPQANNINLIIRHLRVETDWQLAYRKTRGQPARSFPVNPTFPR